MLFRWLRNRRRRRLLADAMPGEWCEVLDRNYQHYRDLPLGDRDRLCDLLRVFVDEKRWEGCAGLEVTDEMKVTIAAQACLLTLNLDDPHDVYRHADTILLYPAQYAPVEQHRDAAGVVHERPTARLGEAHYMGPVVLSWASALAGARDEDDGRNVVYHEFAHKLDMADDLTDGTPPLHSREDYADWVRVMTREFHTLRDRTATGKATLLDEYGATNVAEFFAVATEFFFEKPKQVQRRHPQLYDVLQRYFRQDPAARMR